MSRNKINSPRFRLQRVLISLMVVVAIFLGVNGIALASDISTATYFGLIRVSNNSTATSNVSTVMTLSSASMIDQGWVDEDFTHIAMRYPAGSDVPFQPSANSSYPWCLFVPSIGNMATTNYFLYTGTGDMSSTKYYFPGLAGMTTADSASLEISDNGSVEVAGYLSDNGTFVLKQSAFKIFPSQTVSGNITACVASSTTATENLTASGNSTPLELTPSAGDNYACIDEIPANDADYVSSPAGGYGTDVYTLTATGLPDTAFINSVNVTMRIRANGVGVLSYGTPILILNSVNTTGTTQSIIGVTPVSYNEALARPGGGVWDIGDLNGLQLAIRIGTDNATEQGLCTQVFVAVNYSLAEQTVSIVDVDKDEHSANMTVTSPFLSLGVDNSANVSAPAGANLTLNMPLHHVNMQGTPIASKDTNAYSFAVTNATWGTYGRTFAGAGYLRNATPNWQSGDNVGTIFVWFRTGTAASMSLFVSSDEGSNDRYFRYYLTGNKLTVSQANADAADLITGTTDVVDNTWHLGTLSSNGTAYSIYLDTTPEGLTVSGGANTGDWFADTDNRDNILVSAWIRAAGTLQYFTGTIGEVAYYSINMSQQQINNYYEATKWRYDGTVTTASNTYFTYNDLTSAVPNNAYSLYSFLNGSMPYVEYQSIYVNGVPQQYIVWEYGTTFTDLTGNSHDATPTFRTASSDSDVSAELISFEPIDPALAPSYAVSAPPSFITASLSVNATSANFTSGNVTAGVFPGSLVIDAAAEESGTPNIWIWGILGALTIALAGLFISYMERHHGGGSGTIILRIAIACVVFGFLTAIDKFDFWMLVMYLFIAIAPAMASRQIEWGGSISELGLIGFLSMVWVGLTTINRIQEGQLITSTETAHLNRLMFTQEFTLLDVFHLPIINFEFFSTGIPSLLKWDYAFFGGNAQLIQYLLYSLTAIVSFMVLLIIIGTVSSFFARRA